MDDFEIVELLFERNEEAISEIDRKYGSLCFKLAKNILNDDRDTEECLNDVFLGVWNAIPPAKPNNLKAFVCKIARNSSLKRLAYNTAIKRSNDTLISLSELEEIIPDEKISSDITDEEFGELINQFLSQEKEEYRKVFIRKYWFFDSVSEIAKKYSYTESKVKSMLYRSRTRLQKFLENEGIFI